MRKQVNDANEAKQKAVKEDPKNVARSERAKSGWLTRKANNNGTAWNKGLKGDDAKLKHKGKK
jgi:hypothetical protein